MSHLSGLSLNKEMPIPTSKAESEILKVPERFGEPKPRSVAKTLQKRAPLSVKEVVKMMQPSQTSSPPPADFTNMNGPPASQDNTSHLNYNRDYYHELGLTPAATNVDICNAFRALGPASAIQQEAYEILTDDYLRDIYDDARAFAFNVANLFEVTDKEPEKKPKMNLAVDYYKVLGVQPGPNTTGDSIKRAYKHKVSAFNQSSVTHRRTQDGVLDERLLEKINEAHAILSDNELRKKYDLGRGIPLQYRAPLDKGRGPRKK
jgi:hypothetical protein